MNERRPIDAAELAVGLGVVLGYSAAFLHWDLLVDDAFISFRYADQLRQTGELVYNSGERVEGASSLLWTLLLALLGTVGFDPVQSAPGLGYFAGLGTLLVTVWAAKAVLHLDPFSAWFAGGLCAMNSSFSFWAASGLETPLFAGCLLCSWVALESTTTPWSAVRLGAAGALVALVRPEGMLIALGLPGALLLRRARPRAVLAALGVVLVSLTLLELWRLGYYGALIPNSVLAKSGFSASAGWRGARYLGDFLLKERFLWLLPLWLVGKPLVAGRWSLTLLVAACALVALGAGGDGLYRYRLAAHGLPLLALGLAAGLDRIRRQRPKLGVSIALVALALTTEPLAEREFFAHQPLAAVRQWEARWTRVGRALRRVASPGALLATNVAGRVPYYSRLPTLDMLGLTDPVIARQAVTDFGRGYAGHERAAPDYVLSRLPEIIYLSVLDGLPARALADPNAVGRVLASGSLYRYAPLVGDRRWREHYRPAQLRLDDGSWAALYLRRGSRTEREARQGTLELGE